MSNPVEFIAKLQTFHEGRQDAFLNMASFTLKLLSLTRRSMTNSKDNISTGLSNIAEHINSSRFVLRFLTGVNGVHQVIHTPVPFLSKPVNGSSTTSLGDQIIPCIRYAQKLLQIAYNLAELPAYVHTVAPTMVAYNGPLFGAISCQIWFLTTLLELAAQTKLRLDKVTSGKHYRTTMIILAAELLLSSNWSLPPQKQFLSEWTLTLLGCVSAWLNFYAEWKRAGEELQLQQKQQQQQSTPE